MKQLEILLVEDTPEHIENAKKQLEGNNIVYVTNYCEAIDQLKTKKFDVVLTDLHIPYGRVQYPIITGHCGSEQDVLHKPESLGYAIALYAKMFAQTRDVAIVTDVDHHKGILAASVDDFHKHQHPYHDGPKPQYNGFLMLVESKDYGKALQKIKERKF